MEATNTPYSGSNVIVSAHHNNNDYGIAYGYASFSYDPTTAFDLTLFIRSSVKNLEPSTGFK